MTPVDVRTAEFTRSGGCPHSSCRLQTWHRSSRARGTRFCSRSPTLPLAGPAVVHTCTTRTANASRASRAHTPWCPLGTSRRSSIWIRRSRFGHPISVFSLLTLFLVDPITSFRCHSYSASDLHNFRHAVGRLHARSPSSPHFFQRTSTSSHCLWRALHMPAPSTAASTSSTSSPTSSPTWSRQCSSPTCSSSDGPGSRRSCGTSRCSS